MIRGAPRYYERGLARSPAVEAATAEYFCDNDSEQQWIDEWAELGGEFRMSQTSAYESYREFMEANGARFIPTRVSVPEPAD
jgi:phage/plasmid-associated DNA primase